MKCTTDERLAGSSALLLWTIFLITAPLWIIPAAVWMIATGRNPKSCGMESNQESEG